VSPAASEPNGIGRTPGGVARDLTDGPLAGFTHDVDATRFVLLGLLPDMPSAAVITFAGPSGLRYLYAIDPAAVRSLREAAGLPLDPP
jgi:hypothetical protein